MSVCALVLSDLNRTFPDNVQFRKTSNPCLQHTLYNVLLAYGHHNPTVGYCQVTSVKIQQQSVSPTVGGMGGGDLTS